MELKLELELKPIAASYRPLLWSVVVFLCLAGCKAREPEPAAAIPAERVTSVTDDLQALATDLGRDQTRVELRYADGSVVFRADFLPDAAQYLVRHELYMTQGAPPQRGQWNLPRQPGQNLTQKSAIEGTLFLYQNVKSATAGHYAAQDHYGCDLGPLGRQSSCSDVGACCDVHDQCYADNGCTTSSWSDQDQQSKCQQLCNVPALSCVLLQTPKPGKSICCNKGADFCGQTRNPAEPTPSVATPADVPRWDGETQYSAKDSTPPGKKSSKKKSGAPGAAGAAKSSKTPVSNMMSAAPSSKPSGTGKAPPSGSKPSGSTTPSMSAASKKPSTSTSTSTAATKKAKGKGKASKPDAGVGAADPQVGEGDDYEDDEDDDEDCDELGECDDDDDFDSASCDPDYDPFCDDADSCDWDSDDECDDEDDDEWTDSSADCDDDDDDDDDCEEQSES